MGTRLLRQVGESHCYQFMALGIFAVHWALTGAFVTSMGFTLREDPFVCPHEPLEAACKEYVCGLPWQQWHTFI